MRVALVAFMFGSVLASQGSDTTLVRIAGLGRCSDIRDIVLHVQPHGGLMLNEQRQKLGELGRRLEAIYATRWSKHLYVTGDQNVPFGDVLEVIRIAAEHVDYVVIVTPSVLRQANYRENGKCLSPNLPPGYPR